MYRSAAVKCSLPQAHRALGVPLLIKFSSCSLMPDISSCLTSMFNPCLFDHLPVPFSESCMDKNLWAIQTGSFITWLSIPLIACHLSSLFLFCSTPILSDRRAIPIRLEIPSIVRPSDVHRTDLFGGHRQTCLALLSSWDHGTP